MYQLVGHRRFLTVLAVVSISQRLALLALRPSLVAASCWHSRWCSTIEPRVRAHGKCDGVERRKTVAAPDARTLQ